ncbi:MAG TPA: homoserine dehydrogenase, partial [Clostridiales bacterium]|nr:homoserine dehydrogenase [Clostridiales bacterium]
MIEIAILGYGVVGSGVAEFCEINRETIKRRAGAEINVKKILDIRSFPGDPFADRITADPDEIFNDPSITVVVETIGGVGIAYELSCKALQNHKHVVTSNKELVATYGPELMALAQANGVNYMFEASVGGGIPIIRPLHKCLSANIVMQIAGILNGTTNFILTRMDQDGIGFAEALSETQALGYAEQNPAADIEGTDACRKIAILASITYSEYIDSRLIYTEGITSLTTADMTYAARLGCKLKLIGRFKRRADGRADLIVAPMLIPRDHPVSVADGVNNAILVEGNALGEAMF